MPVLYLFPFDANDPATQTNEMNGRRQYIVIFLQPDAAQTVSHNRNAKNARTARKRDR